MRTIYIYALALLSLLCGGCSAVEADSVPEERPSSRTGVTLVRLPVSFKAVDPATGDDTKSVVTVDVEDFADAFLLAFWADGPDEGELCVVDGNPVAMYTDSKTFEWDLPAGEAITVMAIVNPSGDARDTILDWGNGGLESVTVDDLLDLTFSCGSAAELRALEQEGYNMPMSGAVTTTLDEDDTLLGIPVKRLFAKFNITLDVSEWADDGWTVTAARVAGARSNTEAPYFYAGSGAGFKQTDQDKLATVDSSTEDDLDDLNFRDGDNRSRPVTYYFLENCQGVSASASRWSSVSLDLGSQVDNCSYLKICVTATKEGYGQRSFAYRIYLDSTSGSAMRSTFNVIRNTFRSIILRLGAPQDGFQWTNANTVSVAPGETVSIPFETTLSMDDGELVFHPLTDDLVLVSCDIWEDGANLDREMGEGADERRTDFLNYGTVTVRAREGAGECTVGLYGGDASGEISDRASVLISRPVHLNATADLDRYAFKRFTVRVYSGSLYGASEAERERMETIFENLSLRGSRDDVVVLNKEITYRDVVGTNDLIVATFTVLNTGVAAATAEAYNGETGVVYVEGLDITCKSPGISFVETLGSGSYANNCFTGYDDDGDGGPIYGAPFTGEAFAGYFQFRDDDNNVLSINTVDLMRGSLTISPVDGFSLRIMRAPNAADTYAFGGTLNTWQGFEGLRSNVDWEDQVDDCTFWNETFSPLLTLRSESGALVCSEPVHLNVVNPFSEWFPSGSSQPVELSVIVDGSTDYVNTRNFIDEWPWWSDFQPEVMSVGNVTTSKNGYSAYTLIWEYHRNEIESVRIANDQHNCGCIVLGATVTHSTSGESLTMLWGKVNVIRQFVIYAGYQFSQVNYLASVSTPYSSGNLSRFIPYFYAPNLGVAGVSLSSIVRTTATPATGINAVNPSEDFYRATCQSEHWWHGGSNYVTGSTDHTGGTLWDCEYASMSRQCLLQNKVVVYSSPKTVTSNGEVSYYELQYAGPRVETPLPGALGHNGYHADFVYSFRDVAYWNEPLVEFYTTGINPNNKPSIKTFSGGERYLALGDYTRIRFFWKMKKANLSKLNAYDTRYATNVSQVFQTTYNNPGDPSYYMYYFGSSMFRSTSQATAYYDPRRNMRERLKLFTPSIPFYRRRDNNVYGAFDGAVSGSYTDEDIVDTHQMGFAYGNADSFWLPGNQIQ